MSDNILLSFERTFLRACEGEDRQSGNVKGRRSLGSGIGDADVQRRFDRMIADMEVESINRFVVGRLEEMA
jgi:hypothetical protein